MGFFRLEVRCRGKVRDSVHCEMFVHTTYICSLLASDLACCILTALERTKDRHITRILTVPYYKYMYPFVRR